jgi:YcxB-like protein
MAQISEFLPQKSGELHFHFRIPPLGFEDYKRGSRLVFQDWSKRNRLPSRRFMLACVVIGFGLGFALTAELPGRILHDPILVAQLALNSYEGEYVFQGWSLLGLAILIFLWGMVALWQILWSRHLRLLRWIHGSSRSLASEHELMLYDDCVVSNSSADHRIVPWNAVDDLIHDRGMWFLVIDRIAFYWIPDRLVADRTAFEAFVHQRVMAERSESPPTSPRSPSASP